MDKGYVQTIDNLVYHAIRCLKDNDDELAWYQLDDIVHLCAETYNVDVDIVYDDFEDKLDKQITNILNDMGFIR